MSPTDMREVLLNQTIAVIAENGMDKTTTKAIASGAGVNEAYIYRCFSNKDALLSRTFDKLDDELVTISARSIAVMQLQALDMESRWRLFFRDVWEFLLCNKSKCLAFVRYYYSPYFVKYSAEAHRKRYAAVEAEFSKLFLDEADVWMIMNHILNVMLDFAVKVYNGQMPRTEEYSEHVFRVVYASVKQYFRHS